MIKVLRDDDVLDWLSKANQLLAPKGLRLRLDTSTNDGESVVMYLETVQTAPKDPG